MMKFILTSLSLATLVWAGSAAADMVTAEIIAHDRVAKVIVLSDKSVMTYNDKTTMPDDLKQGDKVEVEFTGSEGDQSVIVSVKRAGG